MRKIAAISSAVATGRRINGRDGFTALESTLGAAAEDGADEAAEDGADEGAEDWAGALETVTLLLSCSFSKLLFATTSPGLMPSTWVLPPSVTPVFTARMCATLSWMTNTNEARPFC